MSLSRRSRKLNLLELNDDVFQEILSYLSFDDIAKIRLVCRRFNETCQTLLNKGFTAVRLHNMKCRKKIKAKLPRRVSERSAHLLFDHMEILTEMEIELTNIFHTYNPHVVTGVTCFIPGKVIDECYRLMKEVMANQHTQLDSGEILSELDYITDTATEHFEENILPEIERREMFDDSCSSRDSTSSSTSFPSAGPPKFKLEDRLLIENQRKEIADLKSKVLEQEKLLNEHDRKLIQLEKRFNSFSLSQQRQASSPTDLSNGPTKSTRSITKQNKRSLQKDDEEPRRSKRLQQK